VTGARVSARDQHHPRSAFSDEHDVRMRLEGGPSFRWPMKRFVTYTATILYVLI